MDHMRISGTEPSSVILSQKSIFKRWKEMSQTCQNKLKCFSPYIHVDYFDFFPKILLHLNLIGNNIHKCASLLKCFNSALFPRGPPDFFFNLHQNGALLANCLDCRNIYVWDIVACDVKHQYTHHSYTLSA